MTEKLNRNEPVPPTMAWPSEDDSKWCQSIDCERVAEYDEFCGPCYVRELVKGARLMDIAAHQGADRMYPRRRKRAFELRKQAREVLADV